jgi:hypothetical protein
VDHNWTVILDVLSQINEDVQLKSREDYLGQSGEAAKAGQPPSAPSFRARFDFFTAIGRSLFLRRTERS